MKTPTPVQKTAIIPQERKYWSCGRDCPGHYHGSYERALICISRKARGHKHSISNGEQAQRNQRILEGFINGDSFKEIATRALVHTVRVRQVIDMFVDLSEGQKETVRPWLYGLFTHQGTPDQYVTVAMNADQVQRFRKRLLTHPRKKYQQRIEELKNDPNLFFPIIEEEESE